MVNISIEVVEIRKNYIHSFDLYYKCSNYDISSLIYTHLNYFF
jgi:hypothetical protein